MWSIGYIKVPPTRYLLQFKNGVVKREGAGLSFFYWAPTTILVAVPLASSDVPFIFNEVTADFQAVTAQGQLTYRVADPKRLAGLLDYSLRPDHQYASEDPAKLEERLVGAAQVHARAVTQKMTLREVLASSEEIVPRVLASLRQAEMVSMLGLEILSLSISSIRPTPETARALEAEAREALLRRSDEAVYARRNAAVEQERTIKESELNTEIAVEEKKRKIRETQMEAEVAIEEKRAAFIDQRVENERKDADARGYALRATLAPIKELDWKTLSAVAGGGGDPRLMIAVAFRELAENAQKIGQLNVSPELLSSLLTAGRK